ncbi:hypothetical protein DFH08DRAFT_813157 [Mycena albidolilacea]|uniref:Uncharacterized protein n=1 Tax=Mycena albidolilacea TaxID=1033008 RepID=A0AAD7EMU7_9AGAR|nr:hypothetical protein DFH08DRAFT_813157 [Mycena albidolilacea]
MGRTRAAHPPLVLLASAFVRPLNDYLGLSFCKPVPKDTRRRTYSRSAYGKTSTSPIVVSLGRKREEANTRMMSSREVGRTLTRAATVNLMAIAGCISWPSVQQRIGRNGSSIVMKCIVPAKAALGVYPVAHWVVRAQATTIPAGVGKLRADRDASSSPYASSPAPSSDTIQRKCNAPSLHWVYLRVRTSALKELRPHRWNVPSTRPRCTKVG